MTKEKRVTERQERQLDAWDLVRQEAGERETKHHRISYFYARLHSEIPNKNQYHTSIFVSLLVQTKEKKGALQCKALQLAALWQALARHRARGKANA